jgi:hypothetical protein
MSQPQSTEIPLRIKALEEAWVRDKIGPEALDELRQLKAAATNGADKHLAHCLIEHIEGRPPRNDGEVHRLLKRRENIRQKRIIYSSPEMANDPRWAKIPYGAASDQTFRHPQKQTPLIGVSLKRRGNAGLRHAH